MENGSKENLVLALQKAADAVEHSRVSIPFENKHDSYVQGALRSTATHVSKAGNELADRLYDMLKDECAKQRRKGIELGKAVGYRNCVITMLSIAAVASGLCLAVDIYQAIEFAIDEQNKSTDHHEDGDQKE